MNILCLNYTLNDVTLEMEIRKPFDVLAKGPFVSISRSNETRLELFVRGIVENQQLIEFLNGKNPAL